MSNQKIDKRALVIASGNQGKIREFYNLLHSYPFDVIGQPLDFNVEESGKTFKENARIKANTIAQVTGEWALADDSGLCVEALGGAPGVHSARYANNDEERINRLLFELKFSDNRKAYFSSALCIASPQSEILLEVEGICNGIITLSPRGGNGFGYDPIFEVSNIGLTFAEMNLDQKKQISHRGKAFKLLEPRLKELLQSQTID